ncbi:hypothetical protein F5Y02DRAFT_414683 [Annulohypoxylon stygium]|nr:hypothetical protein F5Y02DRAFT_414683 [Annulohypoxylon stygium]
MESSKGTSVLPSNPFPSHRRRIRRTGNRRRATSLPLSYLPGSQKSPESVPFALPPLELQLPDTWRLWKPPIVHCPPVTSSPSWLPYPKYGRDETGIRLCDTRSLDDDFPFPLKGYTTWEIESMPDQVLAKIIADWHRTPTLSFRPDTGNMISRIAPGLVAKWGPEVCQAEADIMWIIEGKWRLTTHVPVVHKILRDKVTRRLVIIMDYIHGSNLVDIWTRISTNRRNKLITNIVELIRIMQTNTARYPGPVGMNRMRALVHKGYPAPLRMNGEEYDRYMNILLSVANRSRPKVIQIEGFMRTHLGKFVLTNMKLDPSSFVVDKDNVWIVGWGHGGFYPPESELAVVERLMPQRYISLTWDILLGMPHDWQQRLYLRVIAAMIDGDPLEKRGYDFSHLVEYRVEHKTK